MELKHYDGLDGLRGIAVLAVLLFHGGVSWTGGGFLGVEVFFVLSGFLITSLLVTEWLESTGIALRAFWARRARRLLPALFGLVLVIAIYYAVAGPTSIVPGFWGDGIAALFYYSNWHQVAAGTSYFAASGPVSPFQHTWSLAIEEQFYVLWPLIVLGVLGWILHRGRGRSRLGALRSLLALTVAGLFVSALEMGLLYSGGNGVDRVYYGTDTRATGLLAGAAFALWLAQRRRTADPEDPLARGRAPAELGPAGRRRLRLAGAAGLVLVLVLVHAASGGSGWLYPYGFLLVDFATVAMIAATVLAPGAWVDRVLSVSALQAIGQISYGLYLWHFPLFLWLSEGTTGLGGTHLLMFRLGVTLLVSAVSYVFIEQPIRQRRRPTWALRGLAPLVAGAAVAALYVASTIASLPTGVPAAATLPTAPPALRGSDPTCSVTLSDSSAYGVAPVPLAQEAQFEYTALGKHKLSWSGSAVQRFHTCPPKRILLVGDSIAFTLGVPMLADEPHYGMEVADAAILGCAFSTRGELDVNGTWEAPSQGCASPLSQWAAAVRQFEPGLVVVEMGYRDEFDWRWNGEDVHLGQPQFDSYVESQIERYVSVFTATGAKVMFLSVPYTNPPNQADGSPAPASSPARHAVINTLLARVAARYPGRVSMVDIDRTISPGGHYAARVGGQLCRFDGIHFSVYCARLLEPRILGTARGLITG